MGTEYSKATQPKSVSRVRKRQRGSEGEAITFIGNSLPRWRGVVRQHLSKSLRRFVEVDDVLHEALLIASRYRVVLEELDEARLCCYFERVIQGTVRNLVRHFSRKKRNPGRKSRTFSPLAHDIAEDRRLSGRTIGLDPLSQLIQTEEIDRAMKRLASLPDADALLLLEVEVLGYTMRSVAQRLDVSPEKGSSRLYFVKRLLWARAK